MIRLALHDLLRRPLRSGLTLAGIAFTTAILSCLLAFGEGYRLSLEGELGRIGVQLMLVPMGCPYDAAARVLRGRALEVSLPEAATETARKDADVAVAAPMLMVTCPNPAEGRTDLWIGVDGSLRSLKPWLKLQAGSAWFSSARADEVVLGAEAAATEMRHAGDTFYSPETGRELRVRGILERCGSSEDSQFFVPLGTAQSMFRQPGRITAIAIRLRDPSRVVQAEKRLQQIRGAQTVTMTEMMGTLLNLIGAVRTLALALSLVALTISGLAVFDTMFSSLLDRISELAVMRAVGASRVHLFALLAGEGLLLIAVGEWIGLMASPLVGGAVEAGALRFAPMALDRGMLAFTPQSLGTCLLVVLVMGVSASLIPAWMASRLQPARALRSEG